MDCHRFFEKLIFVCNVCNRYIFSFDSLVDNNYNPLWAHIMNTADLCLYSGFTLPYIYMAGIIYCQEEYLVILDCMIKILVVSQ